MSRVRELAAVAASPSYRRWRRILRSLTLDPDELPDPLPAPGPRDFLICGAPRTGTALLTAALFRPPDVVTVMEPWDALRMPPAELFASLRNELATTGVMSRGRLDIDRLVDDGSVAWCRDGERPHPVEVHPHHLLGVKFPAFWRYLDLLPDTKFLVCLRHPAEVVRSFRETGGALASGLEYDVPFNGRMNDELRAATGDPALRRVLLYDHIHRHVVEHLGRPNVLPVRYERWFDDPDRLMREIGDFLGVRLGPARPVLRRPVLPTETDARDLSLLRRHCRSARALGYPL